MSRLGLAPAALAALLLLAPAGASGVPPADDRAVFLLVDTSGSLGEAELALAQRVAAELAGRLGPSEQVGVMSFDDRPEIRLPLGTDRSALRLALDQLRIQGRFTTLNDALYDAAQLLAAAGAGRRAVLLLTDGRDENSALLFEDAERALSSSRVAVFAIGVGPRVDERFMRRLSKLTGGDYYPVERLSDPAGLAGDIEQALKGQVSPPGDAVAEGPPVAPSIASTPPEVVAGEAPTALAVGPRASPAPTGAGAAPSGSPGGAVVPREVTPTAPGAAPFWGLRAVSLAAMGLAVLVLGAVLLRMRRREPARPLAAPTPGGPGLPTPRPPDLAAAGSPTGTLPLGVSAAAPAPAPPRFGAGREPLAADTLEDEDDTPLDPLARTVAFGSIREAGDISDVGGESLDRTFFLEMKPLLVVRRGRNSGETYLVPVEGEVTIGRASTNPIVIDDSSVSSRHFRLRAEGKIFTLGDLGSTNGTYVNDRRIERGREVVLQEGDVVRIGQTELVFKIEHRRR